MNKILRDYAALTRISNLPTCWTNVLTGCALGSATGALEARPVVTLSLVISLFYVAGMALNDLVDLPWDKTRRPQRPIAAGRISPKAALIFVVASFAAGLGLLTVTFARCLPLGCLLIAMIVLYNFTHKRHAGAIVFMAACRALIYVVGACAVAAEGTGRPWQGTILASGLLALYIGFVTWIARREDSGQMDRRRWLAIALACLVPAACGVTWPISGVAWIVAVVLLGLLARAARGLWCDPPRVQQAVMTWLACLCLLDSLFLCTLSGLAAGGIAAVCFVVVTLGHLKIKGT